MEELRHHIDALRRRQRLQNILSIGVLVILMFAMGGADTVARTLVESDAWKVRTKKADLTTYLDRLVVTTDVDRSKVRLANSNLQLELQSSLPALTSGEEGTIGYDSTLKKLKYWNGTAWVETSSSGGGGGADTWRLEWITNTASGIRLRGLDENDGGKITINGAQYNIQSGGTTGNVISSPNTLSYVYAFANGTLANIESSTTPPTRTQYDVYSTKTGDSTRRFVGMGWTNGTPSLSAEMVRSVKNECGYAYLYKHAPATALNHSTTNSTWTDFDPVISRTGLFFDQERIRAWASVMIYHPGQWVGRDARLGVSLGGISGVVCDDSEVGGSCASGGYWAAAYVPFRAEGYVTVSGAGLKNIRPIHRAAPGGTAQWYTITHYPASVGFEVLR
jgi:hypothetical protein